MRELGLTSVFFKDPSVKNWASAREAGFTNIEVCYRDSYRMDEMIAMGDTVYHNAIQAGMTAASAHLPFLEPWDPSSANVAERKRAVTYQKQLIDHIADFGIPLAVLHPSFEPLDETERSVRLALAAEAIADLGEHAARRGVCLAVENLPRTCLGRDAEEMIALTDHGKSAKITMDVNHLLRETHAHYIELLGQNMVHMHLSDYDRADEKHWLPGNGVIDWKELFQLLDQAQYSGNFIIEIREYSAVPGQIITPAQVMKQLKERVLPEA